MNCVSIKNIHMSKRESSMKLLLLLGIIALIGNKGSAVHRESSFRSNSGCYGTSGPNTMTLNCSTGQIISIEQIWIGVKENSTECPPVFDVGVSNDTSCCNISVTPSNDCLFAFDHTDYDLYHKPCNGKETCTVQVLQLSTPSSCNQTGYVYPSIATFAYIDYFCVNASELNPICTPTSVNITSDYTYITSDGFPSAMSTSASTCTCSVQTDDPSATLQVVTIQRALTGNSDVTCDQALTLRDSGQNETTWTCDDNTYVEETTIVNGGYVILSLANDRNETDGTFWAEVKTSTNANLTLVCPAILLESTTASTTTTTDITSTTTDAVSSSTTTTEASTTTTGITSTTTDGSYTQTTTTIAVSSTLTTADAASTTNADISSSSVASTTATTITTDGHTINITKTPESTDDSLSRTIIIVGAIVAFMLLAIFLVLVCIMIKPRRKGIGCCGKHANKNDVKIRPAYTDTAPAASTVLCETENYTNKEIQTVGAKKSTPTQTGNCEIKPPMESVIASPVTHVNATPKPKPVKIKHRSTNTNMKRFARPKAIQAVADVRETYSQASVAQRNQETATPTLSTKERTSQTIEIRTASRTTQSEERYFQHITTRETEFKNGLIKLIEKYPKHENKEQVLEESHLENNVTRVEETKEQQKESKQEDSRRDLRDENVNRESSTNEVESDMKLPKLEDMVKPKRMPKKHQEVLYNKMLASFFDEERADMLFEQTFQQYNLKKHKKIRGKAKKKNSK